MLPKIFKAKTNDVVRAIALTKADEAEFFDFGGLHAQLKEIDDRVMSIEGDLSEEQIEAETAKILASTKLAENPAILALARKRVGQGVTSKKKPRR